MSETSVKSIVLALLRQARTHELELLATLTDADRAAAGNPERWSAKDSVAHIAAWRQRHAEKLATTLRGETPPTWTDMDLVNALNAEQYPLHASEPWPIVAAFSERAYTSLLSQVEAMTEADLAENGRFPALNGGSLWGETLGNGVWHVFTHLVALAQMRGDAAQVERLQSAELAAQEAVAGLEIARGATPTQRATSEYNMACRYALAGRTDDALAALRRALSARPELALHARHDGDFASLREHPGFIALTGAAVDPGLISAAEAQSQAQAHTALVIDVRDAKEYAEGHVAGAVNIPVGSLRERLAELPEGQLLVTYCNMRHRGTSRCEMAASLLAGEGYDARALDGGYPGWKQSGLPVVEPAKA